MPRNHGNLNLAGKVRKQTPKVPQQLKKHRVCGRAALRAQFNRVFVSDQLEINGKHFGPNSFEVR